MQGEPSDVNARGAGRRGVAATANSFIGPDGSFAAQLIRPDTGEILKLELSRTGACSVLQIRGDRWRETSIAVAQGRPERGPTLAVQTARSAEDGSIEARATTASLRGHYLEQSLRIQTDGSWRSEYDITRPSGARITGEASSTGGPEADIHRVRRKVRADGAPAWTAETHLRSAVARTNARAFAPGGNAVPAVVTTSTVTYADGSTGSFELIASVEKGGPSELDLGKWRVVQSGPSSTTWQHITETEDARSITEITRYKDGSEKVETTVEDWVFDGRIFDITGTETNGHYRAASGQMTTWHERHTFGGPADRPAIDPGGAAGKLYTDSWERTVTDSAGHTTTERGTTAQSDAGRSTTTSVHHPDGTSTITTTTTDGGGHGTRHTTVVDRQGNPIRDTTEDVGPAGGSSSGSHGSSGSTSGGSSGGTTGGSSDDDDGGDDGGDDGDDGGDDGAPLGDELGPSGRGAYGGGDGPEGLLPGHAGRAFGSAIVVENPLLDPEHEASRSVPAHMRAGLTHDALVMPWVAYGGGRTPNATRGVAHASEGNPDSDGAGALGARPASGGSRFLGVVTIPPEEAVQLDNPEVAYGLVAQVIAAHRESGAMDAASLDAAERLAREVGGFAARLHAGRSG